MNDAAQLGDPNISLGQFPACFAFSIHKSGSTLMFNMIRDACAAANIPAISYPDVFFREGKFDHEWQNDRQFLSKITDGRLYFGFRYLPEIFLDPALELRKRKSVLLVRDPRDALVSQYFSFGGPSISHVLPGKNQEQWVNAMQATAHLGIDEYVLEAAALHLNRFTVYKDQLFSDNLLLCHYEQVYYDKRKFLGDLFAHFNLVVKPEILDPVAVRHDIRPAVEDPSQHIRQGTPGDYHRKLRPETIARLNEQFRDTCRCFGYDLTS